MITDLTPGEIVHVPFARHKVPDALRCRFVRVGHPARPLDPRAKPIPMLVVANDKGTEESFWVRYVFKSREDALEAAAAMTK